MRPPVHLVDFVEVERDFFTGGMGGCFEGPGGFAGVDGVGEGALQFVLARIPTQPYTYIEEKKKKGTSIMGVSPRIPTRILSLRRSTSISLPLRLPGMGAVTETSRMVWVHL